MPRYYQRSDRPIDPQKPWNDDEIRHLRKLWDEGATIKQMMAALDRTKGSIIGKIHKAEFPARPSPIRTSNAPPVDLSPPGPVLAPLPSLQEPEPAEGSPLIPLVKTESMRTPKSSERIKTCIHTAGGRGHWIFCDNPATHGVWCADHHLIAIVKPPKEDEDA